ncbi:uncharacterized protein LOC135183585 [Pogoniulus pusillus]|uniref:uncharacterized protein LOC135183585 n=1 Tax=Pogoniulus pusillus TaxID=488313 RepID=UPI0030B949EF
MRGAPPVPRTPDLPLATPGLPSPVCTHSLLACANNQAAGRRHCRAVCSVRAGSRLPGGPGRLSPRRQLPPSPPAPRPLVGLMGGGVLRPRDQAFQSAEAAHQVRKGSGQKLARPPCRGTLRRPGQRCFLPPVSLGGAAGSPGGSPGGTKSPLQAPRASPRSHGFVLQTLERSNVMPGICSAWANPVSVALRRSAPGKLLGAQEIHPRRATATHLLN